MEKLEPLWSKYRKTKEICSSCDISGVPSTVVAKYLAFLTSFTMLSKTKFPAMQPSALKTLNHEENMLNVVTCYSIN